jgi:hypothetical protein
MTVMDLSQANQLKVEEMVQNNVLGFHKISVYALKDVRRSLYLSLQPVRRLRSKSILRHFNEPL